jgi:signal transduction histidine kinase
MLLLSVIILAYEISRRRSEREKKRLSLSEEALRESEARLNAIIQGSPALQFVIDHEHRIVSWNRALEEYSGISSQEMIGTKNHWHAFYGEDAPLIADVILDQKPDTLPARYLNPVHPSPLIEGAYETVNFFPKMGKDGRWLHILAAPVRDPGGVVIGAVETLVDVTEQHLAEDALNEVVKKLNLLSSVTRHDILNKITLLRGIFDIISENPGNNPEYDDLILKGTEAVIFIQKQIVFTRTYENIGMSKPEWNDLKTVIRKASGELPHKEISIVTDFDRLEVYSDPLIQKVFYNLMENSLRHGERVTSIRYTVSLSQQGLLLTYHDDGIGIPPDEKEKIFLKGFGKNSGLGMFLAREILSITHISIRENGVFGDGAQFEIFVPNQMYRFVKEAE